MSMFTKANCTALVACCLTVGTVGAQAALVNFTLTGKVDALTDTGNVFGATLGDDIIVTGTYDDSVIGSGTSTVSFTQDTGNTLSFSFPSVSFTEQSDSHYTVVDSRPNLTFSDGVFTGFNFFAFFGDEDAHEFSSGPGATFRGSQDFNNLVIEGIWSLSDFETTPVPVPATVWLLGSGLLGLVGVARRRRLV